MTIAFDPHRDARRVALGRRLEHLEQVAIGIDAFGLRAHFLFQGRQHPLLQARHVDVHPIVVPIERLWIPGEQLLLVFANAFKERAHVV